MRVRWRIVMLPVVLLGVGSACGSSSAGRRDGGPSGDADGPIGGDTVGPPGDDSDGGPAALRLLAPLSSASVTSRRPTLHWTLDPSADGAHVQICRDRACRSEVVAYDVSGSGGAPPEDLPAEVLFWHARGVSNGEAVQGWTPTWQMVVGVRSAPVDTSWGTTPDVNGDGYADVLVGAPYVGTVSVYLGSATGPVPSPQAVLSGAADSYFGTSVASAGDVNGDGYPDVVVSEAGAAVYLYLGGRAGLGSSPSATLPRPAGPADDFGIRVASAGDVNGDGYADVVVGDNMSNGGAGSAFLYLGGATGLGTTPDLTFTGPSGGGLGHSVDGAGDLNGDGYGDVVVSVPDALATDGMINVYLGGATGLAASPSLSINCPPGSDGGCRVASAGDVNGDGYADIVVGLNVVGAGPGKAYIYLGSETGLAAIPAVTLDSPEPLVGDFFGRWVAGAGDVNGDGYADVVVGADAEVDHGVDADGGVAGPAGWVHLYLGSAAGLASSPAVTLIGPDGPGSWFGRSVIGAGDTNGDGYADVVVGADADASRDVGWAHLYFGGASGIDALRAVTFTGPSAYSHFGLSVASLTFAVPGAGVVDPSAVDYGAEDANVDRTRESRRGSLGLAQASASREVRNPSEGSEQGSRRGSLGLAQALRCPFFEPRFAAAGTFEHG